MLSVAIHVVGETIQTLAEKPSLTNSEKFACNSAYTASDGKNNIAPSAVSPSTMYFSEISLMCFRTDVRNNRTAEEVSVSEEAFRSAS